MQYIFPLERAKERYRLTPHYFPSLSSLWIKQSSSWGSFKGERKPWPVLQLGLPTAWLFLPNSESFHLTLLPLLLVQFLSLLWVSPLICHKLSSPKVMQCNHISISVSLFLQMGNFVFIGLICPPQPLFGSCENERKRKENDFFGSSVSFVVVGKLDLTKRKGCFRLGWKLEISEI